MPIFLNTFMMKTCTTTLITTHNHTTNYATNDVTTQNQNIIHIYATNDQYFNRVKKNPFKNKTKMQPIKLQ